MDTLVVGDQPEVAAWLERRRALGQDRFDEVWEGVYRVAPHERSENGIVAAQLQALLFPHARRAGLVPGGSFNLGDPNDFRVPDLGYHRQVVSQLYVPTAALVIEVLSPSDDIRAKADFYAAHRVDELWIADPRARTVRCRDRHEARWQEQPISPLLRVAVRDIERDIDWPDPTQT